MKMRDGRSRKIRRWWLRPWLQRQSFHGQNHKLMEVLRIEDKAAFKNFLCVEPALFQEIVEMP